MAVALTVLLLLAVAGIMFAIKIPLVAYFWEALRDLWRQPWK